MLTRQKGIDTQVVLIDKSVGQRHTPTLMYVPRERHIGRHKCTQKRTRTPNPWCEIICMAKSCAICFFFPQRKATLFSNQEFFCVRRPACGVQGVGRCLKPVQGCHRERATNPATAAACVSGPVPEHPKDQGITSYQACQRASDARPPCAIREIHTHTRTEMHTALNT